MFGYLGGYLDGSRGLPRLDITEVAADGPELVTVYADAGRDLQIDAMHVPHGIVPALGFRVRVGAKTIVFASDQNGSDERFVDFAQAADLLVMHLPIPETASGGTKATAMATPAMELRMLRRVLAKAAAPPAAMATARSMRVGEVRPRISAPVIRRPNSNVIA